jgi:hypothetical protein
MARRTKHTAISVIIFVLAGAVCASPGDSYAAISTNNCTKIKSGTIGKRLPAAA